MRWHFWFASAQPCLHPERFGIGGWIETMSLMDHLASGAHALSASGALRSRRFNARDKGGLCPLTSKSCVVAADVRPQSFLIKVIPRSCIFKTCAILAPLEVYMVNFSSRPNLRPLARHLAGGASRPARLCPGSESMFSHVKNPSIKAQSRQKPQQSSLIKAYQGKRCFSFDRAVQRLGLSPDMKSARIEVPTVANWSCHG